MTRRRRSDNRLAQAAVAGGLLLVLAHGHTPAATKASATASVTGCGGSNEALANCMAAAAPYDWTGGQTTCLDELWTEESGFSAYAANQTSDARGIPQDINGWSAGYQRGDASQQIAWGLIYVKDRYGTPCAAWAFETSHVPNWY